MMNLFSPPTDSLYKFIAVTGLVSMIGGFVLMFTSLNSAYERSYKYTAEEKLLKKEIDLMAAKLSYKLKTSQLPDTLYSDLYKSDNVNLQDSIPLKLLFSLPPDIQNSVHSILIKRERMKNQGKLTEFYSESAENNQMLYYFLIYGGEIAAILGFLWWYNTQQSLSKLEKTKITIEVNNLNAEDQWKQFCQSCSKTFHTLIDRGTESNGECNRSYCKDCYKNGQFTEPDLTYTEALNRLLNECSKRNYGWFKVRQEKNTLKNNIRWISLRKW